MKRKQRSGIRRLRSLSGLVPAVFTGDIVVGRKVETPTVRDARLLDSSADETVPVIVVRFSSYRIHINKLN